MTQEVEMLQYLHYHPERLSIILPDFQTDTIMAV